MIRHIIKQYNISSKELFTEYTLTIKQHKSHAKLQTKNKLRHTGIKRGLCIDLNKNPRGKCLFGLLFKIHTQMLQHKATFKKEAAGKKK